MSDDKALEEFDKVTSDIAKIKEKGDFVVDMETKEGYEASKRFVLDFTTPARSSLTKAHKSVKEYWVKGGKKVDSIKNELMEVLEEIQNPHQEAYKQVDKLKKEKKERFELALQDKIDFFNGFLRVNTGNSDQITSIIQSCGEVDTSEGFYHREVDAIKARSEALEYLNELLLSTVSREAEEVRQRELAEENRVRQIAIDEQQEKLRKQQEEIDLKQAEFNRVSNEANKKREDERILKENLAHEEEIRDQEAIRINEKYEADLLHKKNMAELKIKQEAEQKEEEERLAKERQDRENKLRAGRTKNRNEAAKVLVDSIGLTKEVAVKIMNLQASGKVPFITTNF